MYDVAKTDPIQISAWHTTHDAAHCFTLKFTDTWAESASEEEGCIYIPCGTHKPPPPLHTRKKSKEKLTQVYFSAIISGAS